MSDIKTWAADVITLHRNWRAVLPDINLTDDECDLLTGLAAKNLFWWRKEQEGAAIHRDEMIEHAIMPGKESIATAKMMATEVALPRGVVIDHAAGMSPSSGNGETGADGASGETSANVSGSSETPAPAPKPIEHYSKAGLTASAPTGPAAGTPPQRTPAVVQKTWERLHFSPYAANNMVKALTKVFAEFEDRAFLLPNATAHEAPQSAPEAYVAIVDALPEKEWQELLKITAAMKSGGEQRTYSRRRF